jgi:tetratricopeptide (TPR) repeat protein
MAVLVEAISVIVRKGAIEAKYPGGWPGFADQVPNGTLCDDDEIARVGFMVPDEVDAFIRHLEQGGLVFNREGKALDIAVVNQFGRSTIPCDWLEIAMLKYSEDGWITACWFRSNLHDPASPEGTKLPHEVATPAGWTFEDSLSKYGTPVPSDKLDAHLKFLRAQRGFDVYLDLESAKEVRVGRAAVASQSEQLVTGSLMRIFNEAQQIEKKLVDAEATRNTEEAQRLRGRLTENLLLEASKIAEESGSDRGSPLFVVGFIQRVLGRHDEAEAIYKRCLAVQSDAAVVLLELTLCLVLQHKPEEALSFASKAVEIAPHKAMAWGYLATCHIMLGHKVEARAAIDRAVSLDPGDTTNVAIRDNFERYFKNP